MQVGPDPVGVHRPIVFRCDEHPAATGLDTAVVLVHGLVEVMVAAFEGLRLCDGEGLDHRLVQLRLLPLSVSTQSAPRSRIVCAIRFWQPMAAMVTMPPSITSISSSAGMAVLALDWSSNRHGPRTRRAASAQTLTRCRCGTPRRTHDRAKSNIPEHCSKPRRATFRAQQHQAVAAIRATVGSELANKRGGYAAGTWRV